MALRIQLDEKEKYEIITKNICNMLFERGEIDNVDETFNALIKKKIQSEKFIIINKKYYIKFLLNRTITKKDMEIENFLDEYKKNHKILIVFNINKKIYKTIMEYSNVEIFWDKELLVNLIDHDIMPHKVEKLNDNDRKNILESYNLKEYQLPQIYENDPLCKYYNGKINDIFRIERYSMTTGLSVNYRIVIPKSDIILLN